MVVKKSFYLFTTSNLLPSLKCCQSQLPPTPPCHTSALRTRSSADRRKQNRRQYATLHREDVHPFEDFIPWPEPKRAGAPLTPYEIFGLNPREPYSKLRFYQLVKLYHPDRNSHSEDSPSLNPCRCSRVIALERYRLVIAANTILSDPKKRQAYDRHGWGWSTTHGSDPARSDPQYHAYTTAHRWRTDGSSQHTWPTDQDPMYNATWEDWERWYSQQAARARGESTSYPFWGPQFFTPGRHQHTVYASNYRFISLVFLFAALGGIGQATRLNEASKTRMERTQLVNEENSRILMKARQDTLDFSEGGESKEKRIKRFLSQKEVYDEGEFDARILREGDEGLCASGAVKSRDEKKFWQKPPER